MTKKGEIDVLVTWDNVLYANGDEDKSLARLKGDVEIDVERLVKLLMNEEEMTWQKFMEIFMFDNIDIHELTQVNKEALSRYYRLPSEPSSGEYGL